jgi:3-deoxy-7-phosphoheptulonate synthase
MTRLSQRAPAWSPESWQRRPALQQPRYPSAAALALVLEQLSRLPPLVTSWEVEDLKGQLAQASRGERFLLQGGDCAERFDDCAPAVISNQLKILLQMSLVLVHGLRKPVTRVGRIAGQYAKPRSADLETQSGVSLPSYRGDLINGPGFSPTERTPDPVRLLRGYGRAAMTLNFIRALAECGFADLHHPENWNLEFVQHSPLAKDYQRVVDALTDSVRFMETLAGGPVAEFRHVQFFTSHEGLHLPYEQAQTRSVPNRSGWYNLAAHFPWIGLRTAQLDGAHLEYFRGIRNPIAVKVGAPMSADWVQALVETLNPDDEPGRLTLIHRFGANRVVSELPPLVEAVRATGKTVLWVCDPMHGNTEATASGRKTRNFDNILAELEQSFEIHAAVGSRLGGVHFELTGEDVTECVGGARGLAAGDLARDYRSQVDPRLNYEQALEMAMRIVGKTRTDSP